MRTQIEAGGRDFTVGEADTNLSLQEECKHSVAEGGVE